MGNIIKKKCYISVYLQLTKMSEAQLNGAMITVRGEQTQDTEFYSH